MEQVSRTASWAGHFDHLLHDQAGLATFTEFLKKAYCQENIYFWIKCEEYKMMNEDQRKVGAVRIYDEHVDLSSSEQINIDENTRLAIERGLGDAGPNIFDRAQKHIYTMLQQDSYRRFLKSDLYQQAVLAESQQRPFPFSGQEVKLVTLNDVETTLKHKEKTLTDTKGRLSLIPISSSKRKSIFSNKDNKKIKNITDTREEHSTLKKLRNTAALPDIEKEEKLSRNATSKGLLGFFRRRSLGNSSKGKSLTQHSVSSPNINKTRIPTMPRSRPIHLSNTRKSASGIEHCDTTPSIPAHDFGNYHDIIQTMCMQENWNGVIKPFSDDDFDNAKYTRTTVLRRRTDGINPGGVIPIREGSASYNRQASNMPSSQGISSMNQKLSSNHPDVKTGCIDGLQLQLSGHRSDSSSTSPALPPPRCDQFIGSTSSSNVNTDVTTDISHNKKHHMAFGTLFSGRHKSSKENNAGRRSIDTAVVKNQLVHLRRDKDFGTGSSRMNQRHSMESLMEL